MGLYLSVDVSGSTAANGITVANLLVAMFQEKGNVLSDLDNYKNAGIDGVNSADFPNGVISYGLLVVFSGLTISTVGGGYPICQILIQCYPNPPIIKCRTRWSETWSSWKSISIT